MNIIVIFFDIFSDEQSERIEWVLNTLMTEKNIADFYYDFG